ncbi:MAG: prepilin-type N-terminal cleavage/methylation domain-containing protein [Candidatus Omnitrophica bacterium]|nr:prepilin-type N-terminal cleavage/methylation domain-containing protein [Candidatus Omnitrophota bacterium]
MNTKAFTLVETMLCVLILSFVLLGVYGTLATGNALYTKDSTLLDMQQQTRNAMDRIVREVRQASSQTVTSISASSYKIVFSIPTATGVQYYLSGTNLIRQAPSGSTTTVASNIALLKFTLNGTLLQIQIQASKTIYNNTISFPLTEQVRLRNE